MKMLTTVSRAEVYSIIPFHLLYRSNSKPSWGI